MCAKLFFFFYVLQEFLGVMSKFYILLWVVVAWGSLSKIIELYTKIVHLLHGGVIKGYLGRQERKTLEF